MRAGSASDAFLGQGFATAQDRLWHMDADRLKAYGRFAEYVGQSGVKDDTLLRRMRIRQTVLADYEALNGETLEMLDAYAAGVSAFVETTRALPVEYAILEAKPEPWEPWDCLAVYKVRHIMMGGFESKLWRARLVTDLGPERAADLLRGHVKGNPLIVPPGAELERDADSPLATLVEQAEHLARSGIAEAGSNNWAVHGSRTASGKPLLAGDPHRGLDTPSVYYQNHIACPEFDAIGLSFPGFPGFPHFGHNAHVAWCVTHAQADYQDLYIERFKDGDPSLYKFKGEWLRADLRSETIAVRGGEPVELRVAATHHGPVVSGEPASGHALSFRYTATAESNMGFQCIRRMLSTTSVAEHDEAMSDWVDPCNNFMFVDVHGDMEYLTRGKVPVRNAANHWLPVPGWTGEHEWQGFVQFDEMPRSKNPEKGYIVTANNKIVGDDYPHYLGLFFSTEYRVRRIAARLESLKAATVADMGSVHAERVSMPAQAYISLMRETAASDELAGRARDAVVTWDGSMERDAVAPAVYSAFRLEVERYVITHLLGEKLAAEALTAGGRGAPFHLSHVRAHITAMAAAGDTEWLPEGETWATVATRALDGAVAYLRGRLGDDVESWTWDRIHRTTPTHPLSATNPDLAELLNPPSLPLGGDGDTPQSSSYLAGAPFDIAGTSVARYVFDPSDWSNSRWITPLGSSGHPGSPHYADQAATWGELELLPMLYEWGEIGGSARDEQILKRG